MMWLLRSRMTWTTTMIAAQTAAHLIVTMLTLDLTEALHQLSHVRPGSNLLEVDMELKSQRTVFRRRTWRDTPRSSHGPQCLIIRSNRVARGGLSGCKVFAAGAAGRRSSGCEA